MPTAEEEMNELELMEVERVRSYRDERLSALASIIWGPMPPQFSGSPHEGDPIDRFEVVLHELCHHVMMPARFVFSRKNMKSAHGAVTMHLDRLNIIWQEVHELYAVAIELIVGRRVKARLNWRSILANSQQNCQFLQDLSLEEYTKLVRRAKRTPLAQSKADIIVTLIQQTRKEQKTWTQKSS